MNGYLRFSGGALLALLMAVLSACASKVLIPAATRLSPAALSGVEWVATVVNEVPYMQSPRPKLRWTGDNTITGSGGCHSFAGRASIGAQNSLRIDALVPTGILCQAEPGAQEDLFFKALELTQQARIEAGQLLLLAEDGRVLLRMSQAAGRP